jgi:hypothetical protein
MNDIVKVTTFQEDIATIKDITTKAFLVTGDILLNIQDDEKYKEAGYNTFAEAVETELGLKKSHAYRLIDASLAYRNVSPIGDKLPTSESQLRPIAKLLPEQQVEVWQEVAKDKVPTAKEVQECVNEKFPKPKKANVVVDKPIVDIPVVDNTTTTTSCTNCFALETELAVKNMRIVELEKYLNDAIAELDKYVFVEADAKPMIPPSAPVGKLPRAVAFEFIKKHGNAIQLTALTKDNLPNVQMFNMTKQIREKLLETTPPQMLPKDIMSATEII